MLTAVAKRRSTLALVAAVALLPAVLLSPAASYVARLGTALVVIALLLRRPAGVPLALRTPRRLLAASLSVGLAASLLAVGHQVVSGEPPPLGWVTDWVYLLAGPLAVLALLRLPRDRPTSGGGSRAVADCAVAGSALAFLVAGLLLEHGWGWQGTFAATAAALAYPVCTVTLMAVVLSVVPRVAADLRPFLWWAGGGLVLIAGSDLAWSLGTVHGWYDPSSWPALLGQGGLGLLLVAAVRGGPGARPAPSANGADARVLLVAAAPYLPMVAGGVVGAMQYAEGRGLEPAQIPPLIVLGAALVARHLLSTAHQERIIARLKQREREASRAARMDELTGLGNRRALVEELDAALAAPGRGPVALALLDLDDFKDINDTHGHDTGDEVLRQVSRRVRDAVPAGALVARLGGDEFAVCSRGDDRPDALGAAIAQALEAPVVVGTRHFSVGASVGVVVDRAGAGSTAAEALSHVDVAMYRAKETKASLRCSVVVLTGEARRHAAARVRLRDEVSRPDLSQFRVVYQPVVELQHGQTVGAEALLRWRHPVLGEVPPHEFVPLAEQVGAIGVLGEFALRTAVASLAGWLAEAEAAGRPLAVASVGVNLSPRQMADPTLVDLTRSVLEEHGVAPNRLVLEITEEALVDDWETAVDVVRRLRQLGVQVAVDDFGTGYSSLRYLRRFETSILKVDREFVQGVADEPRTGALVASVLHLASLLELRTVAEGVETLEQLQVLRAQGCHLAQGYLFDRPLEAADFGARLLSRQPYALDGPALSPARTRVTQH